VTNIRPEGFQERKVDITPFTVRVSSYQLDRTFYSSVDNIDPGAVIARAEGKTRDDAEQGALRKAQRYLEASAARIKDGKQSV
jgi:hypothetical protein